jgi:mRNA-degrading endonuclease toxin of MazEF toxin-antitoxin module
MKPWEIWTWKFPDAGEHPAVVLGTEERLNLKQRVCVILCSTQRATRRPEIHEVVLDQADGLDWETLCKCDVVYAASKGDLLKRRGMVTPQRRHAIGERVIRALGLAGL